MEIYDQAIFDPCKGSGPGSALLSWRSVNYKSESECCGVGGQAREPTGISQRSQSMSCEWMKSSPPVVPA